MTALSTSSEGIIIYTIHLWSSPWLLPSLVRVWLKKEDRAALLRHAAMVVHGCKENLSADEDHKDLEMRYQTALNTFNAGERP